MSVVEGGSGAGREVATIAPAVPQDESDEIKLRSAIATLWRRKLVLLVTMFLLVGPAVLLVAQTTPIYTAETLVTIVNRGTNVVELDEITPAMTSDATTRKTQAEILRSRSLARTVIDQLGLEADPEFNPSLRPKKRGLLEYVGTVPYLEYLNPLRYIPPAWMDAVGEYSAPMAELIAPYANSQGEDEIPEQIDNRILNARVQDVFLSNLEVTPSSDSHVIGISFVSKDPVKAAIIADTIAESYVIDQLDLKVRATRRANTWLSERIIEFRTKVVETENAVESYRTKAGIVESGGIGVTDQQLSELNSQLIVAQADRAEIEARLQQIRRLRAGDEGIESAPEVLGSSLIQELKQQEAALVRKKAELLTAYRERHPTMINMRAELRDLRSTIDLEVGRVMQGLENEVEISRARESALRGSLDKLGGQVANLDRAEVRLRELEREAEATRAIYDTFLSRFMQTSEQESLQEPDARIISRAAIPTSPTHPKPLRTIGITLVGSILVGLLIIVILESPGSGFRSREELEKMSGMRVLGLVPAVRGMAVFCKPSGRWILRRSDPAFHEAIRTVNTRMSFSGSRNRPKVVLVTSSVPDEGKSLLSAAMALQSARSGRKCLLVDCDFRRSRLNGVLGKARWWGLSDVLSGTKTIDEVVQTEPRSGLDYISCGSVSPESMGRSRFDDVKDVLPSLLASNRMRGLLAELGTRYDLVIIDSPPVIAVSDAHSLSRLVDKTVFVVRWRQTRQDVALSAFRDLVDAGADIAGIVMSRVNMHKYVKFGFADSALYSSKYQKYY